MFWSYLQRPVTIFGVNIIKIAKAHKNLKKYKTLRRAKKRVVDVSVGMIPV